MSSSILPRIAIVLCFALVAAGCRPRSSDSVPTVVVYSSVDEVFAEPICRQFEDDTGIHVDLVSDTEETKSTGLLNRLIAEKDRPRADVFWSGDPVRAAILKSRGVSAAYHSVAEEGLPGGFSDPDGHWTSFSARARVLIYNKDHVPEGERPTSVRDLADPRFRNKACMANPLFGTTTMHAAALFQVLGEDGAKKLFQAFRDNGVQVLSSNGEVRRRVANGEFFVGLTDSDDVNVAIREGQHVGFVFPDQDSIGTLIVPNAAVLIKDGPHPEYGKKFVDYLLLAKTEAALAKSEAAQIPLREGVRLPKDFPYPPISKIKTMQVDYATLGPLQERLVKGFLREWVDRSQ